MIEELDDLAPALSFYDSELNDPWSTARDTSFTEAVPDLTYDSELSSDAWSLACDASLVDVIPLVSKDTDLNNPLSVMLDMSLRNFVELELDVERVFETVDDSVKTPRELVDDQTLASLEDTSMSECESTRLHRTLLAHLLT